MTVSVDAQTIEPSATPSAATTAAYRSDGGLAWLALRTALFTVLTLGVYRFWMKTRLREYYWGATRLDGEPLEYTGRPMELLLGFLIAIFFLAIYLGVVVTILMAAGLLAIEDIMSETGQSVLTSISLIAVLPFIPYASYRSQRYLLSRTRWRGIRFGLDLAAWSYAGRWLLWTLASVLTLGLLSPIADFSLRRFITERMTYGDQKFRLVGKGGGLYYAYLPAWATTALAIFLVFAGFFYSAGDEDAPLDGETFGAMAAYGLAALGAYVVSVVLFVWYGGYRLRYLINRMVLGDDVRLRSALRPSRIMGRVVGGYVLTAIIGIVFLMMAFAAISAIAQQLGVDLIDLDYALQTEDFETVGDGLTLIFIAAALYVLVGLIVVASYHVLVAQRVLQETVSTASVENLDKAAMARQRAQDKDDGAEGFADALDVGAF